MSEQTPTILEETVVEVVELLPITVTASAKQRTNIIDRQTINPFLEKMYGKTL
jgi:hypothetical protein